MGVSNRAMSDLVNSGMSMSEILTNRTALRHFYSSIMTDSMDLAADAYIDQFRYQMSVLLPRAEIQVSDGTIASLTLVEALI